jgi:hypothetical protein
MREGARMSWPPHSSSEAMRDVMIPEHASSLATLDGVDAGGRSVCFAPE